MQIFRSVEYANTKLAPSKQYFGALADLRKDTLSFFIQEHNERTSTEFNLVTAQSTAHEPPEDGRKYGPKHVGASFLKCFQVF
jgi:hypothetical protein